MARTLHLGAQQRGAAMLRFSQPELPKASSPNGGKRNEIQISCRFFVGDLKGARPGAGSTVYMGGRGGGSAVSCLHGAIPEGKGAERSHMDKADETHTIQQGSDFSPVPSHPS